MQPCPSLSPLEGTDGKAVIRKFEEIGQMYNECADAKMQLINAVK